MKRTFHGKTRAEMKRVLNYVRLLKDKLQIPKDEVDNFDIAIQCIETIINHMNNDKKIEWD